MKQAFLPSIHISIHPSIYQTIHLLYPLPPELWIMECTITITPFIFWTTVLLLGLSNALKPVKWWGDMVVQWLVLSPHSKKVAVWSHPWELSVLSLHAACVYICSVQFLRLPYTGQKMHVRWFGNSKFSVGLCVCEYEWLYVFVALLYGPATN